jgi:hypothetical protein
MRVCPAAGSATDPERVVIPGSAAVAIETQVVEKTIRLRMTVLGIAFIDFPIVRRSEFVTVAPVIAVILKDSDIPPVEVETI